MRPPGTKQLEDTATARPVSYAAFIERTAAVMRSRVVSLPERDRARAHTAPVGGDTMAADLLSRGSRELAAAAWWLGGG